MTPDSEFRYEFSPGLPVPGVAPGTNLLVSGTAGRGARAIAIDLLAAASRREGMLIVSADVGGRPLLDRLDEGPYPVTRTMLGIVDCTGETHAEDRRFLPHAAPIADPGDLTSIEIEFSLLYEKLAGRDPRGIRTGLFSLSSLLAHAPLRDVSRFLHMLTGRVIATDDLGVFVIDSTTQDARTVETMSRFCDGHVEVQDADGGGIELRVTGLADHPEAWTPVDYDVPVDTWASVSSDTN